MNLDRIEIEGIIYMSCWLTVFGHRVIASILDVLHVSSRFLLVFRYLWFQHSSFSCPGTIVKRQCSALAQQWWEVDDDLPFVLLIANKLV